MSFRTGTLFGIPAHIVHGTVTVRRVQEIKVEVGEDHQCKTTEELCNHAEQIVEAGNFEGPPITESVEAKDFVV